MPRNATFTIDPTMVAEAEWISTVRRARCSYDGVCSRRSDPTDTFDVNTLYLCPDCELYYCFNHSHSNPTRRRSQYCSDHGVTHPTCWDITMCSDHLTRVCGVHYREQHFAFDSARPVTDPNSYYHGGTRDVTLDFKGEVGSHNLAMGARYVGMEIEAEGRKHFELPNEYGIVSDGSVDGWEVLTPPARGEALVETVTTAMKTLKKAGYKGTSACGVHVHFDLRNVNKNPRFLSRLFALGFAVEDLLYSLQKLDRHEGDYAHPLRSQYAFFAARGPHAPDFEYVYNKMDKTEWMAKQRLNELRDEKWGNRYLGFNFHSVFYRDTLEVRIHEGTLDPERILLWTDTLQSIIKKAESRISYKELLDLMHTVRRSRKIEKAIKVFDLSKTSAEYLDAFTRPELVEIPFNLHKNPTPEYL